jgi:hypothetical protein
MNQGLALGPWGPIGMDSILIYLFGQDLQDLQDYFFSFQAFFRKA